VIEVALACTPEEGFGATCDDIPFTRVCEEPPNEIKFIYNTGNCIQSMTTQPNSLFVCQDFNGGPPTEQNVTSYT
jgi:hypothetical protein